jgi:hypothetical protein
VKAGRGAGMCRGGSHGAGHAVDQAAGERAGSGGGGGASDEASESDVYHGFLEWKEDPPRMIHGDRIRSLRESYVES